MEPIEGCFLCHPERIPSELLIFNTERFVLTLDAQPAVKGHIIVAPKMHYESLAELPHDLHQEFMSLVRKTDLAVRRIFSPFRVVLLASGFFVAHYHFHVIPVPSLEMMKDFKFAKKDDVIKYSLNETTELIEKAREFIFNG
jgi:histidine triad (HIT) family protein